MAPPPELNTDAVAEILLRLPPDDPTGLVRASAVCKPWLRTLNDPAFLRRYRDFHGPRPPHVLGFFHKHAYCVAPFIPTTAFRPHIAAAHRTCAVVDCRHGRVLLYDHSCKEFVVWDPVTGRERRIHDESGDWYSNHAVLCAATAAGCDHSNCSGGPFVIACAGSRCNNCGESYACSYSSETGTWSEQTSRNHPYYYSLEDRPAALVGGALYFAANDSDEVLRYDVLGGRGLFLMKLPFYTNFDVLTTSIVMKAANGGLGLATFEDGMLSLWSAEMGTKRGAGWSLIKDIDLQELLPMIDIIGFGSAWLSGFAEDTNVIFLSTVDNGIFTIDLKSLLVRKASEMGNVEHVFPYVSFHDITVLFSTCARGALQSLLETQ